MIREEFDAVYTSLMKVRDLLDPEDKDQERARRYAMFAVEDLCSLEKRSLEFLN